MEIGGILGIFYIMYLLFQKFLFNDRRKLIKFFVYTFKKKGVYQKFIQEALWREMLISEFSFMSVWGAFLGLYFQIAFHETLVSTSLFLFSLLLSSVAIISYYFHEENILKIICKRFEIKKIKVIIRTKDGNTIEGHLLDPLNKEFLYLFERNKIIGIRWENITLISIAM